MSGNRVPGKRPILEFYEEERAGSDPQLIKDAQRVFESLLFTMSEDEVVNAVSQIFHQPEQYRSTVKILKKIAERRTRLSDGDV